MDLILGTNPDAVYVTHYSQIRDIQAKGAVLHRLVDAHAELGLREKDAGAARPERLREGVKRIFLDEARRWVRGCRMRASSRSIPMTSS